MFPDTGFPTVCPLVTVVLGHCWHKCSAGCSQKPGETADAVSSVLPHPGWPAWHALIPPFPPALAEGRKEGWGPGF